MDESRTLTWTSARTASHPSLPALPQRYTLVEWLGHGGMGSVWTVRDQLLDREVALKVLHHEVGDALIAEARAAARLDHPAILPVHDVFTLPDGRNAFTMRLVRGRPLGRALPSLSARRRVELLRRIAEAVAFAHDVGVVHRDLKPSNVLLGPFGEVWVVDWGLSSSAERAGTPRYMPPESDIGPAVDVYALGVMLGEQADAPELEALAASATAADPAARPTATAFAAGLGAWLDGDVARQRAQAHVDRADALAAERSAIEALRTTEAARLAALVRQTAATAAIEDKRPLWALEDALAERRRQLVRLDAAWERTLHAALAEVPDEPAARRRLAARAIQRVTAAADRGEDTERLAEDARLWDPAWYAEFSVAEARLELRTDVPAGAVLHTWRTEDRRLVLGPGTPLGPTPLSLALPPGSHVVVLEAEGRATVRYPVQVRRGEVWRGDLTLPPPHPDLCWVPAGPAWLGGDPLAPNAGLRVRAHVGGFGMMRFPVTNRAYAGFLNALVDRGEPDRATTLVPRIEITGNPTYQHRDGHWFPGVDDQGHHWDPDLPVLCVTWAAASAYASWWAERTGRSWRLPGDVEWEKAARGVDGRCFPWGDHFEVVWANTRWTRPDHPMPAVVDSFPTDESPYGIRGLGGNAIDWVLDDLALDGWPEHGGIAAAPVPATGSWRSYRGGAWALNEADCRAAGRMRNREEHRTSLIGFRLVVPWPS